MYLLCGRYERSGINNAVKSSYMQLIQLIKCNSLQSHQPFSWENIAGTKRHSHDTVWNNALADNTVKSFYMWKKTQKQKKSYTS